MDALLAIPIGVDAQLDQLVLDTLSLRSQVLLLDHAAHATHRIDAVIAKVGIALDPLMKAYRIAVEANTAALALYHEVATLTTVLSDQEESGSRLEPALRRSLERTQA